MMIQLIIRIIRSQNGYYFLCIQIFEPFESKSR